jgi:hypothetical protein
MAILFAEIFGSYKQCPEILPRNKCEHPYGYRSRVAPLTLGQALSLSGGVLRSAFLNTLALGDKSGTSSCCQMSYWTLCMLLS